MRKVILFICVLIFIINLSTAQNDDNAPQLLENIHLHLNKTTFIEGEHVWFKAYIFNQSTKLPALATTNLHVGMYDSEGQEVNRKLFRAELGMAQGDFAIDSTYTDSEYTIFAWTNFMRNFEDLQPYRQKIRILKEVREEKEPLDAQLKISIYPEGGELIAGAYNQIGILVNDGLGQGVSLNNLELVDENGQLVLPNIATNSFGMGKTGLMVEKGKRYFIQWQRSGVVKAKSPLPESTKGQLGLNLNNKGEEIVLFKLLASETTLDAEDGNPYTLAIYQDEFIGFENFNFEAAAPQIVLQRNRLPYGVLTAVLLDESLSPIARRLFFNHRSDNTPLAQLTIEQCPSTSKDSIQVDFILQNEEGLRSSLSVSVLPKTSLAYKPDHSLRSSFLLKPYTTLEIQDGYYLEKQDRQRRYELDKRLLIEGWGRYDWDSRILEEVKLAYENEKGILVEGSLLEGEVAAETNLVLKTELVNTMEILPLETNNGFSAQMNLVAGDAINISLLKEDGNLAKPKKIDLDIKTNENPVPAKWLTTATLNSHGSYEADEPVFGLNDNIIALDEVIVTEKRKPDNRFYLTPNIEGRWIGDNEIKKYRTLITLVGQLGGFSVGPDYVRRPPLINGQLQIVPVIIDGTPTSPSEWIGLPLSRVKAVTYSKSKSRAFISVTLNPDYVPLERRNSFVKFLVERGYTRPQQYFHPNYPDNKSITFKNYGALHWYPSISVGMDVPISINIPIREQSAIQLYVEGIVNDGSLISMQKTVQVRQD